MTTRSLRAAFFAALVSMIGVSANAADDTTTLFNMGKAAYYRGDLEQAQQLLSQVAQRDPRHFETRALLAQIKASLKDTGDMSLKKTYESVTLAKVDFTDVTFEEALEGLRALSKNATGGKVMPNFIVQDQTLNAKPISLNLTNIPLSEAISYLAKVAGCKMMYEKHAVVFNPTGSVPPAPAEAKAPTG